jgi:hypothetical protein
MAVLNIAREHSKKAVLGTTALKDEIFIIFLPVCRWESLIVVDF